VAINKSQKKGKFVLFPLTANNARQKGYNIETTDAIVMIPSNFHVFFSVLLIAQESKGDLP
jgi:hypothetical protein